MFKLLIVISLLNLTTMDKLVFLVILFHLLLIFQSLMVILLLLPRFLHKLILLILGQS